MSNGWSGKEFERLVQKTLQHAVPAGKYGALAIRLSNNMALLRCVGNAINPWVAAKFINAFMGTNE